MTHWLRETFEDRYIYGFTCTERLVDEKTPFQHVQIFDTAGFGRALVLDGACQLFEATEFVYHEALIHPTMFAVDAPRRVLVIGGGDGGCVREILKHPNVEQVTLCEIDGQLIEWCKQHLPSVNGGCFDDPRLRLVVDDAAKHVEQDPAVYDVIIADLTDPVGPATTVYQTSFINRLKSRLASGGVMAMQAESAVNLPTWHEGTCRLLSSCFEQVNLYHQYVQMYGGLWSFALCADWDVRTSLTQEVVTLRMNDRPVEGLKLYSPTVHAAMFEGFGWV